MCVHVNEKDGFFLELAFKPNVKQCKKKEIENTSSPSSYADIKENGWSDSGNKYYIIHGETTFNKEKKLFIFEWNNIFDMNAVELEIHNFDNKINDDPTDWSVQQK